MADSDFLPWGRTVNEVIKVVEGYRGFLGRSDADYVRMGCMTEAEYQRLLAVSRQFPFAFAICGSMAETPQGLINRNLQSRLSRAELQKYFASYRQNGIPHFNDVDVWFDKKTLPGTAMQRWILVESLRSAISGAFDFPKGRTQVDMAYAEYHESITDLSPMTRKGDRRYAPEASSSMTDARDAFLRPGTI